MVEQGADSPSRGTEWTQQPITPSHPLSGAPAPTAPMTTPPGPVANPRDYWVCLVLAIVTLGLYSLWYHWVVHRELCDYLGRPVREKPLWIAYVAVNISMFFMLGLVVVLVATMIVAGTYESMIGLFTSIGGLVVVLFALLAAVVASLVLFILYVVRQYQVIGSAKQALGLRMETGLGLFLGIYLGAFAFTVIVPTIGFLGYFVYPVAYWYLHGHYVEIWQQAHNLQAQGLPSTAGGWHQPTPSSGPQ